MANTFFGLNIATTGLYAANTGFTVSANNASNETTKGYSRQTVSQEATRALRVYQRYGAVGTGTEVTAITRNRDAYYDTKYWKNQSKYGEYNSKNYYMLELEDFFNDSDESGFSVEFQNIFSAIEDLRKTPESVEGRTAVVNYADSFIKYMEQIKTNLMLEQEDINAEINDNVDKINSITQEIATLNKQINVVELAGANANELRDKRELLLDELSEIVEIDTKEITYDNGKTEFYVTTAGKSLVNNYDYFALKVETRAEQADSDDAVGLYNIKWSYGETFDPIAQNVHGKLYALLEVRDGNNGEPEVGNKNSKAIDYKGVPYYVDEVNKFLETFTAKFNEIQAQGQDLNGDSGANTPIFVKSANGVYSVNKEILDNPNKLCTTKSIAQGTAAYDLLDDMMDFKNAKIYEGGTAIEYLNSMVTEIGIDTKRAGSLETNYLNIQKTIQNQRLSVMGVDADEEAMNLVKYKEAYDLSAQIISIMNQIYDKLINQTGL